ncbi:Protein Asterix [Sorochytrium milnesiophthora]
MSAQSTDKPLPRFELKSDPRREDLVEELTPKQVVIPRFTKGDADLDLFQLAALALALTGVIMRIRWASWGALLCGLISAAKKKATVSDGSNSGQTMIFAIAGIVLAYSGEIQKWRSQQ